MISLINGNMVDERLITFNTGTYHFMLGPNDITDQIHQADKVKYFPGFDKAIDTDRLYRESRLALGRQDPGAPLNTSTWDLFTKNVANSVGTGGKSIFDTAVTYGAIGLTIYFLIQSLNKKK